MRGGWGGVAAAMLGPAPRLIDQTGSSMSSDELFRPTVRDRPASGAAPWRPDSILYPAFFGGALTAATLGVLNGRRLGVRPGAQLAVAQFAVAGAGLVAIAVRVLLIGAFDGSGAARLFSQLAGVPVWLVVLAVQRRPFRAFTFGNGEPARLIGPGLLAAIGCGLVESAIVLGLT
jgi:hypothetical protein